MKLHANIDVDGKLLRVTLSGNWSFNAACHFLKVVFDTALEEGANLILIDCLALESTFTTIDRYRLGTEVQKHLFSRRMQPRIAIVGKPPASDGFGVLVASNRGVVTKMFSSHGEALNWLQLDAKNRSPIPRSA
jgi:hypothetical protein